MKFKIYLTLALLIATANVFGQENDGRPKDTPSFRPGSSRRNPLTENEKFSQRPSGSEDRPTSSFVSDRDDRPTSSFSSDREDRLKLNSQQTSFEENQSKFDAADSKASSSKENVEFEHKNDQLGGSTRFSKQKEESSNSESRISSENKSTKFGSSSIDGQISSNQRDRFDFNRRPSGNSRLPPSRAPSTGNVNDDLPRKDFPESTRKPVDFDDVRKPTDFVEPTKKPFDFVEPVRKPSDVFETSPTKPVVPPLRIPDYEVSLESSVHVTGSILLARNKISIVDSVEYGGKSGRWNKPKTDLIKSPFNDDSNMIDPESRVVLYVSTLNSFDVHESFMNFTIPYTKTMFPLDFNVELVLPESLSRLLRTEDLKLYFFAFVYHSEPFFQSFIPDGTCQIVLQGTNRIVQRVEVFLRPNGLELKGALHGFYGTKFIRPGTSFQILVIAEEFINRFVGFKVDYVGQIVITDVPSMFPLSFSGIVPYRNLKSGIRYYAIAYIFEDGVERLLTPVPILVINENHVVVTTELSIKVTPFPFIIYGTITRLMPGNYYFETGSSIILNFYQVDAQLPPIVFRLPSIEKLPLDIQVNLSQALHFDPTKKYEILASVTDRNNEIYMTSAQRLLLDTTTSRFTIPVEDVYYYVRVNFRTSIDQLLSFMPGSTATLFVTETPEITRAPLFNIVFDPTEVKGDGYLMKMPIRSISRVPSAYMILLVNNTGIITHVAKVLFISNYQPPALRIDLPVIPLNLIRGQITDFENNIPQWSSWAYANIMLLDDHVEDREKSVVQSWKIYLEREFPINFEVHLDFSLLIPGHSYSLESSIETRPGYFEYKPVNTIRVIEPEKPIQDSLHLMVKSVKVLQLIDGIVYLDSVQQYLTKHGEVVVYLSSNQILSKPDIVFETRMSVDWKATTVNFTMEIPLDRIDLNGIYYFLVQYVSDGAVIIAPSQVFSYTPRNGDSVILRLSKSEQIQITGEIVSTGGLLLLPESTHLLLQVTDSQFGLNPKIYTEVVLPASTTNLYRFTMYFDTVSVPRNATVYLRAAVIYKDNSLIRMPRPAPIQVQHSNFWNIVLTIDLPTLLIGQISLVGEKFALSNDYDAYVQILIGGTETVLSSTRLRLGSVWPQPIRVEVNNEYFAEHNFLEARAVIKSCKEETIYRSANSVQVHSRLNLDLDLQIAPYNTDLLKKLTSEVKVDSNVGEGFWAVSIRGTSSSEVSKAVSTLSANIPASF